MSGGLSRRASVLDTQNTGVLARARVATASTFDLLNGHAGWLAGRLRLASVPDPTNRLKQSPFSLVVQNSEFDCYV